MIDDDALLRVTIRRVLERAGHTVIEAAHGGEALTLLAQQSVNVVLTDLYMPHVDGMQLLKELRKAKTTLRIVAMSGEEASGPTALLEMARHLGAAAVLPKPFTSKQLLKALTGSEDDVQDAPRIS